MTVRTRCRAVAAGVIAAAAAAAATAANAAPAKAAPPPDTTPPTISIGIAPSPGTGAWSGWYAAPTRVTMTASDDSVLGVTQMSFTMTGAQTDAGESNGIGFVREVRQQGVTTLKVRAVDAAGNVATTEYGVGIDLTSPSVLFRGSATDGEPIRRGDLRRLEFTCSDVPTAIVDGGCYGRVLDRPFDSGDVLPTATTGRQVVTVTAIDAVGRWVERQFGYTVLDPLLQVTKAPRIAGSPGTARVGDVLSVEEATFAPAATSVRYHWTADGVEVGEGTSHQVTPQAAGKRLSVHAVATRDDYAPTTTAPVGGIPVGNGTYQVTGSPTVTGTAREGGTLRIAEPAAITPEPSSRDNLWTIAGVVVETDSPSIALTSAHVGRRISCVQAYRGTGYDRATAPCRFAGGATSVVVTGHAWTLRSPARITGKAKVRRTLRAVAPVLSGRADRYAYQWLRNGRAIKGATGTAYRPRAKDARARISVRVTATTAHRPATVSVSAAQRVRR